MLVLKGCTNETCDGFNWVDTTGDYNAEFNPGGYGPQNEIEGPADFDSYTFSIWAPTADPATDPPTFTYDLLTDIPEPDEDGYYTWEFDPGLQTSGVYYFRTVATYEGQTVGDINGFVTFSNEIRGMVRAEIDKTDPFCACKPGCEDPYRLLTLLHSVVPCGPCGCATVCTLDRVRQIIKYLYSKLPGCGC